MNTLPDVPYVGLQLYVDDDMDLGLWNNLGKVKGGLATISSIQSDGYSRYWVTFLELGSYTQYLYSDSLDDHEYQLTLKEKFGIQISHLKP